MREVVVGVIELSDLTSRRKTRYLARKRLACADLALSTFLHAIEVDPDMKLPANPINFPANPVAVYRSPFINLSQLVVLTVQRNAQDLFTELQNQYRSVLDQDRYLALVCLQQESWISDVTWWC